MIDSLVFLIVYSLVLGRMNDIYSTDEPQEGMVKTLKIPDELHKRLSKHGTIGETYADVIEKLLDYYESHNKRTYPSHV